MFRNPKFNIIFSHHGCHVLSDLLLASCLAFIYVCELVLCGLSPLLEGKQRFKFFFYTHFIPLFWLEFHSFYDINKCSNALFGLFMFM